uniref:Uncharacterized protein n=1 Tax=Otolemur garnettii TaxID=30611 RepID=H0Y1C0_OTOGA
TGFEVLLWRRPPGGAESRLREEGSDWRAASSAGRPLSLFPSRVPPPTPPTPHTPCLPVSLGNLQLKAIHPHGNMYPSNKKKKVWREEKERLLKMTLEERRKEYVRDFVPLNTILSWKEEMKGKNQND